MVVLGGGGVSYERSTLVRPTVVYCLLLKPRTPYCCWEGPPGGTVATAKHTVDLQDFVASKSGGLRDQTCTIQSVKVDCVMQVDS